MESWLQCGLLLISILPLRCAGADERLRTISLNVLSFCHLKDSVLALHNFANIVKVFFSLAESPAFDMYLFSLNPSFDPAISFNNYSMNLPAFCIQCWQKLKK